MKNEWKKTTISEVADLIAGFAFKSKDFGDFQNKVIKIKDIIPPMVDISGADGVKLDSYSHNRLQKYKISYGDYVLAMTGATIGKVGRYISTQEAYINQRVLKFCPDSQKCIKDFLYYILMTPDFLPFILNHIDSQSVQPNISASSVGKFQFLLPPLEKQHQIALILSSLDEKIELNAQINRNLEEQAKAIFFNYYNASTEKVSFSNFINICGGGTPRTGEATYWNGEIPFFTPKDADGIYVIRTEKNITNIGLSKCNSKLYPTNTVFVTARGTVGKVAMAGSPMAMNQSCYALLGEKIHQILVYYYTLAVVDSLKHKASGAVFDAIVTKDFETEKVCKISEENEQTFLSAAIPIFNQILMNKLEGNHLAQLRDTLLPKLMSGEIDVSEVEV